jgi:hypothetical protein
MSHLQRSLLTAAAVVTVAVLGAASAWAAPVVINTPFMNLEHRAVNSLGFGAGTFLRIGANAVTPNGDGGTVGVGTTTNLVTGAAVSRSINFNPGPAIPNFFSRYLADDRALYGPWTLTFSNGADRASAVVDLADNAQQAPFVNSISLSGTSANPTFAWTPPTGATVNGYRVNIYDKALVTATNNGQVSSTNLQPSVTSFTVDARDFTVPGYAFTQGHNYSIEISLIQTKDGSSTNLGNANLQAIARVYADFTPTQAGGPVVNLPVVLSNGSYQFNMTVQAGQTYYIDPEVAVGYEYATGDGDFEPNFLSVDLPDDIGDGLYDIAARNLFGQWVTVAHDWRGTDVFNFGPDGVNRFRVTGIETSAGLNPGSTTAFITGLTFTGSGTFTGTQTPITVSLNDVPEPPTLALAALALLAAVNRSRLSRARCSRCRAPGNVRSSGRPSA